MNKIGFDTDLYLNNQVKKLNERLAKFERLYLEFGGKLFADNHAKRVLPGFRPTAKIELLKQMGKIDLFYCVSAEDLVRGKIRVDSGLSYDLQTIKDIKDITGLDIPVTAVVITLYKGQPAADQLSRKLKNLGFKVYFQNVIEGYPKDTEKVLKGYENQPYIKTKNKLVVVTGAGGGSGKMALCLSQIHAEKTRGVNSGFAKFETFPVWDLPADHPVNVAYEAATADLGDFNEVDPFHSKEYGVSATNYNRDIENFTILKDILVSITGEKFPFGYKSPTDMGVNMISTGITDDDFCKQAAREEIIRRYFNYSVGKTEGKETLKTLDRINEILIKSGLKPEDREVVKHARQAEKDAPETGKGFKNIYCGSAIQLKDGRIVTGKNSPTFHSESAAVINALKVLAGINDDIDLISPKVLAEIAKMREKMLDHKSPSLAVNETLIVLASCATDNKYAKDALQKVNDLRDCELHSTFIISSADAIGLRNLGINYTSDTKIASIDY